VWLVIVKLKSGCQYFCYFLQNYKKNVFCDCKNVYNDLKNVYTLRECGSSYFELLSHMAILGVKLECFNNLVWIKKDNFMYIILYNYFY